jgi:hypothetical protein
LALFTRLGLSSCRRLVELEKVMGGAMHRPFAFDLVQAGEENDSAWLENTLEQITFRWNHLNV